MKNILILFLLLTSFSSLWSQSDCENTMECKVIAPSGMRMRSEPSLKSSVVTYVPKDSLLSACTGKFGTMRYEDINGYWRKVSYRKFEGYMFDGFLEILKINIVESSIASSSPAKDSILNPVLDSINEITGTPLQTKGTVETSTEAPKKKIEYYLLTEAYNYCGDIQKIDPGMYWYGIYPKDEETNGKNYRIKTADVNVILSKQKVGKGLEFDIQTADSERSIFLIGSNTALNTAKEAQIEDNSEILRFNSRKVYPGQQWTLSHDGKSAITLSATGSVESSGPCPDLKNYKLILKGEKYFLPVEQNMTDEIVLKGQCGMPEIYWYGDLNGDKVPEMIFVSVYEDQNQFTLFVSDPTLDNVLVKKEAQWILSKCY